MRLGRTLRTSRRDELTRGVLQDLLRSLVVAGLVERSAEAEEERGAIGVVRLGQLERLGVEAGGGREGVECERAVARLARDGPSPLHESAVLDVPAARVSSSACR